MIKFIQTHEARIVTPALMHLLQVRLVNWRHDYQEWRKGGAKGAKAEVEDFVTAAPGTTLAAPDHLRSRATGPEGDLVMAATATATIVGPKDIAQPPKETATFESPAPKVEKPGTGKWAGPVVTAAPETLPAVAGFLFALCAAAVRDLTNVDAGFPAVKPWRLLAAAWAVAMVAATPWAKAAVDAAVPKTAVRMLRTLCARPLKGPDASPPLAPSFSLRWTTCSHRRASEWLS